MHFNSRLFLTIALLLVAMCFNSCRKDPLKGRWDVDVLVPLANGKLDISHISGDTLIEEGENNLLRMVYRNSLYRLNLAEYIEIPDTSLHYVATLDSLRLSDRSIVYPVTLGAVARQDQSGFGGFILLMHGSEATIPPFSNLSGGVQEIDATEFFETATFRSGTMEITIENGFPVDITDLEFALRNKTGNELVFTDEFSFIGSGASVSRSYDLSGKTLEGTLLGEINNMSSPGSNEPVKIDTNDAITLTVLVRDMELESATAIFPEQNLINVQNEVVYDMRGAEFTYLKIRSGKLVITAHNTIPDSLHLRYKIPGAISPEGQSIDLISVAPPAPTGGTVTIHEEFDLSGYAIDLTGLDKNQVNTFSNEFSARLDSTGRLVSISLNDSISVFYGLIDIVPEYIEGFAGKHDFVTGDERMNLDIFSNFTSGELSLEKVDVVFSIFNTIGAEGNINIDYLRTRNSRTGAQEVLNAPGMINEDIQIERAGRDPFQPGIKEITLDQDNSNIHELVEILPDQIEYRLSTVINPDGNLPGTLDFMHFDDYLDVSMDLSIPLSLSASGLVLLDTTDFSMPGNNGNRGIEEGVFTLFLQNHFPLDVGIQIYFLDVDGKLVDSLFANSQLISAADLDRESCRVITPKPSRLEIHLDQVKMDRIQFAKKVIIKAVFNTQAEPACGEFIRIYSDYTLDFKLAGDFTFTMR